MIVLIKEDNINNMSEEFNLSSISEIKEYESYESTNKYLKLGWLLLSTHLLIMVILSIVIRKRYIV